MVFLTLPHSEAQWLRAVFVDVMQRSDALPFTQGLARNIVDQIDRSTVLVAEVLAERDGKVT